jgi:hypothetical protein
VTDVTPIAGKLSSLVRLHASDKTGEVAAAAAAINRMLRSAGADIHALADRIKHANGNGSKLTESEMRKLHDAGFAAGEAAAKDHNGADDFRNLDSTTSPQTIVAFCQQRIDRLSTREQEFIASVALQLVWRELTPKQTKWLTSIFLRLGGKLR